MLTTKMQPLVSEADVGGTVNDDSSYVVTALSQDDETDGGAFAESFDATQASVLDAADQQLDQVAVWDDPDADGENDLDELQSLSELGVESIELTYRDDNDADDAADIDADILSQDDADYEDATSLSAEEPSLAVSAADVLGDDDDIIIIDDDNDVDSDVDGPGGQGGGAVNDADAAAVELDFNLKRQLDSDSDVDGGGLD